MQKTNQIKEVLHKSRRGLKELDVIFEKFNVIYLDQLKREELTQYITLLTIEDHDLLNLIVSNTPNKHDLKIHLVLAKLKSMSI